MSGALMVLAAGFSYTAHLDTFKGINTAALTAVNRIAGVHFYSNGELKSINGNASSPIESVLTGTWGIPQGALFSPGGKFELYASLVSGTLTTGDVWLDSWTDLGVFAPLFSIELSGVGTKITTLSFQIRSKATLTVITSGTYELSITPPP